MLWLRAGCFQGVGGQRQGVGDNVSEVGTRWLDWEGAGDEACGLGCPGWGTDLGWRQGKERAGDKVLKLGTVCPC